MADKPPVHTVKTDAGWGNRRAGSNRVAKRFDPKSEVLKAARQTSSKTEHVIHNMVGKTASRLSWPAGEHQVEGREGVGEVRLRLELESDRPGEQGDVGLAARPIVEERRQRSSSNRSRGDVCQVLVVEVGGDTIERLAKAVPGAQGGFEAAEQFDGGHVSSEVSWSYRRRYSAYPISSM